MNIFVTSTPKQELKMYFLNFRSYVLVDALSIKEEELANCRLCKEYVDILITQRVNEELKKAKRRKKNSNIILITDTVNELIIDKLNDCFDNCIENIFYIKKDDETLSNETQSLFDRVLLLSSIKKKCIIKCIDMIDVDDTI